MPGLDLREVQDLVDQFEQVRTGRVNRLRELDLFLGERAFRVLRQEARQDQERVERGAEFVGHVRQELRLVAAGEGELRGLVFQREAGLVDFAVLLFDFGVLLREQFGLFFELFVGLLQLGRQRLRLLEQLLGSHRRGDRVEHDADRFGELAEEVQVAFR